MLFSVQTRSSYIGNLTPSDCIIQVGKHCKKQHADVRAYPMDEDTIAMLNAPNNALICQFLHQHPKGPIIWEQTRYEHDVYYCENNIITTNIIGCANNSSPITSTTSG